MLSEAYGPALRDIKKQRSVRLELCYSARRREFDWSLMTSLLRMTMSEAVAKKMH